MEGFKEEYISLQAATQHCNYSQEYLSLRARQGKLKAVKFGRNWVTKEEWLNEYLSHAEEYNNNGLNGNHATFLTTKPPRDLPTETFFAKFKPAPKLNFAVSLALVFVLMVSGITFGKESFKNAYQDLSPLVESFNANFDRGVEILVASINEPDGFAGFTKGVFAEVYLSFGKESFKNVLGDVSPLVTEFSGNFGRGLEILTSDISGYDEFAEFTKDTFSAVALSFGKGFSDMALQTADAGKLFVEYGQWVSDQLVEMKDVFVKGYISANKFAEVRIRDIIDTYKSANEFVENKLHQGVKLVTSPFKGFYNFVTFLWGKQKPGEIAIDETTKEELEALKEEVKQLKEEGLPVKEVIKEVSKVVQPVTEITREKIVSRLDDVSLAMINSQITNLQ
ncbi:MAG: hypothetical protein V1653_05255 [bacterium]